MFKAKKNEDLISEMKNEIYNELAVKFNKQLDNIKSDRKISINDLRRLIKYTRIHTPEIRQV